MRYMDDFEVQLIRKNSLSDFGEFLKKKRNRDSVSQEDLAEQLGVSRTEISHYENGKRDMPFSSFFVLGECFGFDMKDYALEISSREAVSLFEKAIYREVGKDKETGMDYLTTFLDKSHRMSNKEKETLEEVLRMYFDSEITTEVKQTLVLADMLYQKISNKRVMNELYFEIVQSISDSGNKRLDAFIREYIQMIRNER